MDRLPLVLSSEESQNMQEIPEAAHREQLGQQMVGDLLDISELTDQPIKHMVLNKTGVFEEAEGQEKTMHKCKPKSDNSPFTGIFVFLIT
nr:hypothetical protein [Acinetobacter sp. ANC 4862]